MATYTGTSGDETVTGTDENDTFAFDQGGSDTIKALDGADQVTVATTAGDKAQTLFVDAGDGGDTITYRLLNPNGVSQVALNGGAGDDTIALTTTTFSPTLSAPSGPIVLEGGAGTDVLDVRAVRLTSATSSLIFQNFEGIRVGSGASLTTEQVAGVSGNILDLPNIIQGSRTPTYIALTNAGVADFSRSAATTFLGVYASAFGNAIMGGEGGDFLVGGVGRDILHGGLGDDTLRAVGKNDQLFGDEGNDTLDSSRAGSGAVDVDGGTGSDLWIADLSSFTAGFTVHAGDFAGPDWRTLASATVRNVETVSLTLGSGEDTVYTGATNDAFVLGAGADTAYVSLGGTTNIWAGSATAYYNGSGGSPIPETAPSSTSQAPQLRSGFPTPSTLRALWWSRLGQAPLRCTVSTR